MLRIVAQNPALHWLQVGLDEAQIAALQAVHPRLHGLAHQEYLASWIGLADIYLNPPRMGGGATVAMAMELGVPVIALAGADGGDKLGALAVGDCASYFARLTAWASDPQERRKAGEQQRQTYREELDLTHPDAAVRLAEACGLAMDRFAQRHATASA